MLSQVLDTFKKIYSDKGDKIILDNYTLDDGTYVIVKIDKNNCILEKEVLEIKDDDPLKSGSDYRKFLCYADYYSKLISMNKAILSSSGKVIQGNNYLSFIIKKDSLGNGKLTYDIIDKFYDTLADPRNIKYKKNEELYNSVEKEIGEVDITKLNSIREWIKNNIFNLIETKSGKDFLKIFFYNSECYEKQYKNEGLRYFIPNIYNNNDYNKKVSDEIYGLPSNNMGLNSKKPYLENKTRKTRVPYLLNLEDVMLQKKFFDYCSNQVASGKLNLYIDEDGLYEKPKDNFTGVFLRLKKGMEVEIHDYDVITNYRSELSKPFHCKNVLNGNYEKLKIDYNVSYKTRGKLEDLLNEVLFMKFLKGNYFSEPKDIRLKDNVIKSNLLISRKAIFDWLYKNKENNISSVLDKITLSIVKNSIVNGNLNKAMDQYNMRISFIEYFYMKEGDNMADIIMGVKNNLREKISEKTTSSIENDKEYFFAVGQIVGYFISKSKGKKKPLSLANPFINAKSDKFIKEKIRALYKKYNYDIQDYDYRFKNLYSMITSYSVEDKIDEDMILAGFLNSNLLYEKIKEDK